MHTIIKRGQIWYLLSSFQHLMTHFLWYYCAQDNAAMRIEIRERNLCYEPNRLHAIVHLQLKLKVAHEHISQPSFDQSLMRKFQQRLKRLRLQRDFILKTLNSRRWFRIKILIICNCLSRENNQTFSFFSVFVPVLMMRMNWWFLKCFSSTLCSSSFLCCWLLGLDFACFSNLLDTRQCWQPWWRYSGEFFDSFLY